MRRSLQHGRFFDDRPVGAVSNPSPVGRAEELRSMIAQLQVLGAPGAVRISQLSSLFSNPDFDRASSTETHRRPPVRTDRDPNLFATPPHTADAAIDS